MDNDINMKRYCQTLALRNDPALIHQYIQEHSQVWAEIQEGIRQVGILDMQIYIHENLLFMIVDTVDDFDWVKDNERLAKLPRQAEWEKYMSKFQQAAENATSAEKWVLMKRIFKLN